METIPLAPHVDSRPGKCGGKPCVVGTRIRVYDIYVWHELHGLSADEVCTQFPQLTVSDVFGALAYFYDHREEILARMKADYQFAEEMEAQQKRDHTNGIAVST